MSLRGVVSPYGNTFHASEMAEAIIAGTFEVIRSPQGSCDCNYEERDPDSYHLAGCRSLFADIKLPSGREQIVLVNCIQLQA